MVFGFIAFQMFGGSRKNPFKKRRRLATSSSYKLHYYLLMVSNHWTAIAWYLNGRISMTITYACVSISHRIFHWHWGFLLAARALFSNPSPLTTNYTNDGMASNTKANQTSTMFRKLCFVSQKISSSRLWQSNFDEKATNRNVAGTYCAQLYIHIENKTICMNEYGSSDGPIAKIQSTSANGNRYMCDYLTHTILFVWVKSCCVERQSRYWLIFEAFWCAWSLATERNLANAISPKLRQTQ